MLHKIHDRLERVVGMMKEDILGAQGLEDARRIAQGGDVDRREGRVFEIRAVQADQLAINSQLRIQGSATYLPQDFADAIELLRAGTVSAADFVTTVRPLADAAAAVADADSGRHLKVLLHTSNGTDGPV